MMERDAHITPQALLESLQFRPGDFADIAIVSGQLQRAKMCLEKLEKPVKNFTFLGYNFWTGIYEGKRITVGNGGFYAPDSAFMTELICAGGVKTIIRLGSCGALKKEINIGDFILADKAIRGDGVTRYYVADDYSPVIDTGLSSALDKVFSSAAAVHKGGVWTTDALFRETKEIVNSYIKKGAIAVDMVTSPLATVANLYKVKAAAILTVSDNLITGELGFSDFRFFDAEMKMVNLVFEAIKNIAN